jgi:4-hydroxy-3-methylbut-2-en-1-yl diphosphate synthase IspG/GcpE
MRYLSKRLTGMLVLFFLTVAPLACTSSKESIITCPKCGASQADLQKQYEEKAKNN